MNCLDQTAGLEGHSFVWYQSLTTQIKILRTERESGL